ncbi:unnamed protein product [Clonostachys rosea f. rosea IK726]|uniref:FAD/NAD(P)-binding domain-containing protein n=2 Tax=Bionectria ochroleuca TaxID=29856 RepID=A0A0B7KQQ1_BIOOC|nr:unnamed protein product [Clonostachys rosea f. rosea IK726]
MSPAATTNNLDSAAPTPIEWVRNQGSAHNGEPLPKPANWIPVHEEPLFTPRKLRVITIGAGFSGLMVAQKFRYELKMEDYVDHVIYEKNPEVGGTWYENQYPGVACDVPAHIYTFTWGPNPKWTRFYANGPEIRKHIQDVTREYNLDRDVKFNARVVHAEWVEDDGKWTVKIEIDGKLIEDKADVIINASGVLNNWKWPNVKGLDKFKGHRVHSAAWDHDYDFTNKRVALIGNGSSAIQILPSIQPIVKQLTTFIRSPTWISPNFAAQFASADGKNFTYSEEQLKDFEDPEKLLAYRKKIEHDFNKLYKGLQYGSPEQEYFKEASLKIMNERLQGKKEFTEKLIPTWAFGCRRLSPGDGYLEALLEPNVKTVFNSVSEFTEDGVIDADGNRHEVDAIICATGFDVSFAKQWPVIGRGGKSLKEEWKENPESYMSVTARHFPNFFFILGPNSPVGNGSLIPQMEWAGLYAAKWIEKMAKEHIHSIDPKQEAIEDFNVYTQEYLKRTVYTSHCRSWYKNNKVHGPVTTMWAGSPLHFKELMGVQRAEDYDIKYLSPNRYFFFGNGITWKDANEEDLSYYLRKDGF